MKLINLTGKKFGKLTAITRGPNQGIQTCWKCVCECGKESNVMSSHLRCGHTKSCGCAQYDYGKNDISWKGYEEIPLSFFNRIKRGAKHRNITFNIKINEIWNLFIKQNKRCALSDLPLDFTYGRNRHHKGTASIDRIDSSKGYVEGNIQWVHKDINWMKQDYSNDYFLEMCQKVCDCQKQREA